MKFLLYFGMPLLAWSCLPAPVQAVEITEILADNQGGLQDADGQSPGWIELHNPAAAPVDLEGWHLTDDPLQPTRWTFPSVSIPAGGYLVVFASGKDLAVAGQPLHTNFRLSTNGEWAILNRPGGEPEPGAAIQFPALRRNISFSVEKETTPVTPLIPSGAGARFLVPEDGLAGMDWIQPGFDDSGWSSGAMPMGFGGGAGGAATAVLRVDFNDRDAAPDTTTQSGFTPFLVGNTGGNSAVQSGPITRVVDALEVTLSNTGADGYDDRLRTTPTDSATLTTQRLLRDFVFSRDSSGTSGLDVAIAGLPPGQPCRVTVWSFDNSSSGNRVSDWWANGLPVRENYTFNGANLPVTDTDAMFSFETVTPASGPLVIGGRRDLSSSTFGVFLNALEVVPLGYGGLIATDLTAEMPPPRTGIYMRIPFGVPDPAACEVLRLKARYDDGFVVWLNGKPLLRRNVPENQEWNSVALNSRSAAEGSAIEEFAIPLEAGWLLPGDNLLAVHGLNAAPDDPDLLMDFSLEGLGPPGEAPLFYEVPTPGTANATGFPGITGQVVTSVPRGFYYAPVTVSLSSSTPGARIRFTLDGSAPTASSGTVYSGPLEITKTTSVRAAAWYPGYIASHPVTATYVFPDQTAAQPDNPPGWPANWGFDSEVGGIVPADYEMDPDVTGSTVAGYSVKEALNALPTLSINMAPEDFLGPSGIYQNPRSTGNNWERACALEFFDPDSVEPSFAEDCQIEIHGNSSRRPFRVQKHSFRLTFRGSIGNSKLRYPLFPGSPVDEFNQLVLRACFTDAWCLVSWDPGRYRPDDATYLRDLWMRESHAAMGYLTTGSRYCQLYINGLYWGMYLISERVDDEFVASHLGGTTADWEVVHDFTDPDSSPVSAWKSMFAAANAGLATPAAYAAIQEWLDPVRFIDYYLLHQYGEAEDWPHHNGYAFRRKSGPDTRYQWGVWDQEIALNNHGIDRVSANAPNTTSDRTPGRLLNRLRANSEFRLLFADRAHRHLHGGVLDILPSQTRWEACAALIDQAIVAESARWGDTAEETPYGNTGFSRPGVPLKPFYTREADWLPVTALVRDNWIPSLHNTTHAWATIRRLRSSGLYPLTDPPVTDPPPGISLPGLEVSLSSPAGGIYYTLDGTDPREPVTGAPLGMQFLPGSPVKLTESAVLKARTLNGGEWSALTEAVYFIGAAASSGNLKIGEILFHPAETPGVPEFIELINPSVLTLDLSGVRFSEGITYTFPAGTQLAPGERLVVTGDQFEGRLDNAGEFLSLLSASGAEIFRFQYGVARPWPGGINGEGSSLVLTDPFADPADPSNWRSSLAPGGSPGTTDATTFAGEADADSDGDGSSDFLEYAMGTAAEEASSQPVVEISREAGFLMVSFDRAAAADDVRVVPEVSSGLDVWAPQFSLWSRQPTTGGFLREVWKSAAPVPPPAFVRLRATGRP